MWVRNSILRDYLWWGLGFALMMAALYLVFIYVPPEREMGDIQRIFYFHVPLAWVAFLAFFHVFVGSILYLWKREEKWDVLAQSAAEIGVVFISLVLITGPIWARPVWGDWWTWDARLTSSLVLWLTYVAYLLVRSYATEEARGARFAAAVGIVGFANVPIVYLSVNLWGTQHPPHLVNDLVASMMLTLVVSIIAFTVLGFQLISHSVAIRKASNRVKHLRQILEEREG